MKFIFDFDGVLFLTIKNLEEHINEIYKRNGISREQIEKYYNQEKVNGFSQKKMLKYFSLPENLYEEMMKDNKTFVNQEVLKVVKKLGSKNCYLVTDGDEEYQRDKIKSAEIAHLFSEIIVTLGSKKEIIKNICKKHKNETIIFVDDRQKFFDDLDLKKCPNLKTILFTGQNLEHYFKIV
jgi:HAD superfamily hydrolase (TIGR01509 family)